MDQVWIGIVVGERLLVEGIEILQQLSGIVGCFGEAGADLFGQSRQEDIALCMQAQFDGDCVDVVNLLGLEEHGGVGRGWRV